MDIFHVRVAPGGGMLTDAIGSLTSASTSITGGSSNGGSGSGGSGSTGLKKKGGQSQQAIGSAAAAAADAGASSSSSSLIIASRENDRGGKGWAWDIHANAQPIMINAVVSYGAAWQPPAYKFAAWSVLTFTFCAPASRFKMPSKTRLTMSLTGLECDLPRPYSTGPPRCG